MDDKEVRLMRGPFSGDWLAVTLASDGRTITKKWRFADEDQATLNAAFPAEGDTE